MAKANYLIQVVCRHNEFQLLADLAAAFDAVDVSRYEENVANYYIDLRLLAYFDSYWMASTFQHVASAFGPQRVFRRTCFMSSEVYQEDISDSSIPGKGFFVYILRAEDSGFFKIGKTKHMANRITSLGSACPYRLHIERLISCPDEKTMDDLEVSLHKLHDSSWYNNEWFRLSKADLIRIDAVLGRPDSDGTHNQWKYAPLRESQKLES